LTLVKKRSFEEYNKNLQTEGVLLKIASKINAGTLKIPYEKPIEK